MSKNAEDQRKQPEFFFIFNSQVRNLKPSACVKDDRISPVSLSEDVAKTHREKLLAELRQFGC